MTRREHDPGPPVIELDGADAEAGEFVASEPRFHEEAHEDLVAEASAMGQEGPELVAADGDQAAWTQDASEYGLGGSRNEARNEAISGPVTAWKGFRYCRSRWKSHVAYWRRLTNRQGVSWFSLVNWPILRCMYRVSQGFINWPPLATEPRAESIQTG